jgi:hypothetical protein
MARVLRAVPLVPVKRCVPRYITWNWHHNRRPGGR